MSTVNPTQAIVIMNTVCKVEGRVIATMTTTSQPQVQTIDPVVACFYAPVSSVFFFYFYL